MHKKAPKWILRMIRKWAAGARRMSGPRPYWDSTTIPSRSECLGRSLLLNALADEIERKDNEAGR